MSFQYTKLIRPAAYGLGAGAATWLVSDILGVSPTAVAILTGLATLGGAAYGTYGNQLIPDRLLGKKPKVTVNDVKPITLQKPEQSVKQSIRDTKNIKTDRLGIPVTNQSHIGVDFTGYYPNLKM